MRYAARVDKNQKEIVEALRKVGAHVIHLHQLKNLFDILVAYKGNFYAIEIKDGSGKLTKGELKCKEDLERVRCTYNIAYNVQDALNIIGV